MKLIKKHSPAVVKGSNNWKLGYARVSTRDQNLGLQLAALERYGCNRIWQEKLSATARNRPELAKLWKELRAGDTLVVWKFDRLVRNAREAFNRLHELEEKGVAFVSITDNIDTTTAVGKLMLGVLAVMAQFERDLTAERTRAGIKKKQDDGEAHAAWTKKFDRVKMQKLLLGGMAGRDVGDKLGVSKSAIYKAIDEIPGLRAKLRKLKPKREQKKGRPYKR